MPDYRIVKPKLTSAKIWIALLIMAACAFCVSCRLCDFWGCPELAPSDPVIIGIEIPDTPCNGAKIPSTIVVTIDGGANLQPSPQYCFVEIGWSQTWCSSYQSFGSGTTVLQFTGFPLLDENGYVYACVTPNLSTAEDCDIHNAAKMEVAILALAGAATKKCPLIEYSCMTGYDIRGPSDTTNNDNLYTYARKRFFQANTELVFLEYSLSSPAKVFSSANGLGGLNEYLLVHWFRRFLFDSTKADFCLIGIRNCVNRANFFGPGKPLPDSAVGLSGPLTGNPDSLFGRQTGAWCLIFKEPLDSMLNQGSRQKGYDRNAVHEFGHSLAGLTHPEEHSDLHNGGADANCVMGMMGVVLPIPGNIESGKDKFCRKCQDLVMAADWVSGRTK